MQWTDSGIVLGCRKHGEASVILELLTAEHGRHMGLVRGGRGKRYQAMLQPGNTLSATWQARLDDQLGNYSVEPESQRAAGLIGSAAALYAIGYLAALLRLLPERDPHPELYAGMTVVLDHLDHPEIAAPLIVRLELAVLAALGFGLDLTECAATGATQELVYVSPKSGRAVSRSAGTPYHDKLLRLPAFVAADVLAVDADDVMAGLALTAYFLERHVFEPRGLLVPEQRAALVREIAKAS
jgi:DNA repair protein RecO (recombination protein O)